MKKIKSLYRIFSIVFLVGMCLLSEKTVNAETLSFWGSQATLSGLNRGVLPPGNYWIIDNTSNFTTQYQAASNFTTSNGSIANVVYMYFSTLVTAGKSSINIGFHCPVTCTFTYSGGNITFNLYKTDLLIPTTLTKTFSCSASATTYVMKYFNLFEDSSIALNWTTGIAISTLIGNFSSLSGGTATGSWNWQYNLKAGDQNAFSTSGIGFVLGAVGAQPCSVFIGGK